MLATGGLLVILLAALLWANRERLLLAIGDYLVVQDDLRRADLIHVAAGPERRARCAIRLYNEGLGEIIFFTGGRCQAQVSLQEQRCAALAEREGIPRQDIVVDSTTVESTYQEAVRLKAFIQASPQPVSSVIVVSDPHHTRRARWTYRRVLGEGVAVYMAPVPFELSPYQRRWWRDEASRDFVLSEYLKFAYYLLLY